MKGFFRTLIQPGYDEDPLRAEVLEAANLLQVGEFQFLQLAYADWFGADMPEEITDGVFKSYMIGNLIPTYARNYARKILAAAADGRFDVNDAVYHRYDPDYHVEVPNGRNQFLRAAGILMLLLFASLAAAHMTVQEHPATSILPPYFNEQELSLPPGSPS